jgi:LysM repeat protein
VNYSSESVKLEIRPHKEDFYLDVETPRGHFFAVLDFAPHDYVNLTPALKNRLEMIVTSFASTSRFSPNLFLGFLALEINNFLSNLSKQSDSPPILCSAALCLVNGNQLSYFLCGDVLLNIFTGGGLVPLSGGESGGEHLEQLGARNSQTTLTNQVKSLTLHDSDTVLIMTQGVGKTFNQKRLAKEVGSLPSSDPKVIRDALLSASAASRNDRTLVVISGPYTRSGEPTLAELSRAVASLETRLNALSDSGPPADLSMKALTSGEAISRTDDADAEAATPVQASEQPPPNYRALGVGAALVALVIALVGGFAGGWFQSRTPRKSPEVWSVRTSGNQIDIARLDENGPGKVTLSLEQPSKTTGEQRFSSFTDVKQYLDMISTPSTASNQSNERSQAAPTTAGGKAIEPTATAPADYVTEYKAKSGDSLMKLAWRHKVSPGRLKELNPNITEWRSIQIGQRIALPSPTPANQPASPQGETVASANSATNATEITVGPGDSVMKLARRHNVAPDELRKLNPTITRWPLLRIGERITLPSPVASSSPATSQSESSASPAASPIQPSTSANASAGTREVRVGKGESLNSLAQLFNCSPRRIKQLNPRIHNWASIHPGQKVVVPARPGS